MVIASAYAFIIHKVFSHSPIKLPCQKHKFSVIAISFQNRSNKEKKTTQTFITVTEKKNKDFCTSCILRANLMALIHIPFVVPLLYVNISVLIKLCCTSVISSNSLSVLFMNFIKQY